MTFTEDLDGAIVEVRGGGEAGDDSVQVLTWGEVAGAKEGGNIECVVDRRRRGS